MRSPATRRGRWSVNVGSPQPSSRPDVTERPPYVAAGWIGAMMGTSFKPWDVAAGLHILSVSGGNVMNLEMGTGLGEGLRPGVVASNRGFLAPSARAVLLEIAQEDTV